MPGVLHLYNLFGAETERVWLETAQQLAGRGYDPRFACESVMPGSVGFATPPVVVPRIQVQSVEDVDAEMESLAARDPDPALRKLLKDTHLAHGHTGPRVLHLASLARRGVPVVLSLYGYDASRLLRDPAWPKRYAWAVRAGMVLVVLCDAMKRHLVEHGVPAEGIRIVRLGLDPSAWTFEPAPAPDRPRFVFIGRLSEKKGVADLLSAIDWLKQRNTDAALEIIGEGPLDEALRRQAMRSQLADRVRFHGRLPRERVASVLASATAFVLPSVVAPDGDREGTPIVLMEAQAVGVPCITTAHSGNPEVLAPEASGFVVAEQSPEAIAEAMLRMSALSPEARRSLQDAGRAWIERQYNLEKTVADYASLYAELLAARAG
jgi:glycosyltransferase involved in cell wall biosynthesis